MARHRFLRCLRRAVSAFALSAGAVSAQDAAVLQAFSGDWFSFDPNTGSQGTCAFLLSVEPAEGGGLMSSSSNCVAPLDSVTLWGVVDGQIRLAGPGGVVATLGGHQLRMTGDILPREQPIVLERANGDAKSQALGQAISTYRCLFVGYSDQCAPPALTEVLVASTNTPRQIVTLVDLNVREHPRSDATVRGVVEQNTTHQANACVLTSDGPWCRIIMGDGAGWIARNALRQDTWPVITFRFQP